MDEKSLAPARSYLVKHSNRTTKTMVARITNQIDVENLHLGTGGTLGLIEIGRCLLHLQVPLPLDAYTRNQTTRSFVFVDPETNAPAGAGMIVGAID